MVLHEGALIYHTDVEVVHKRRSAISTEVYEYETTCRYTYTDKCKMRSGCKETT